MVESPIDCIITWNHISQVITPHYHHQHHLYLYGSIVASVARANKYNLRKWNVVKITIHSVPLAESAAEKLEQDVKSVHSSQ